MVNITSQSFINKIASNKKEKKLMKQYVKCKTRKCSKISKEYLKENKIFENRLEKDCPNDINFECLTKFDKKHGGKTRKLLKKLKKCADDKCSKENKMWKNYKEILDRNFKKDINASH